MTPKLILITFLVYTFIIFLVSWITSRKSNNESFFIGNHKSPWYLVAYGMIGASLSGVTFVSIPGYVGSTQFSYIIIVFGYLFGYIAIAKILLPLYYKLNLTSIYVYLNQRFGFFSYKTGAAFFLISRVVGAAFRMFLVVNILQIFVFDNWNVPFYLTVAFFLLLIILYTFRGGIKTIVWTDTLQTTFMLIAVVISIYLITKDIDMNFKDIITTVVKSKYSKIIFTDWTDARFFLKQFFSGMFITITMTGLDQDMMQKNLSCKNLKDAQKNMYWMSASLVPVNLLFLFLGAVLFIYANAKGIAIPDYTDNLFPVIALKYLSPIAGLAFVIGLISAAYSSSDSALTALTTSFCVDFLNLKNRNELSEKKKINIRYLVHFSFAILLFAVIVVFREINDASVISKLFTVAGYTYGPLLGLYAFGLFTKFKVKDKFVPIVALISPVICYIINYNSVEWLNGYKFGFELLILNGLICFIGLWLIRKRD